MTQNRMVAFPGPGDYGKKKTSPARVHGNTIMSPKTIVLTGLLLLGLAGSVHTDDLTRNLPGKIPDKDAMTDPFGDCCVTGVTMQTFNTWTVTCGPCAKNPGTYVISQPDPAKPVFLSATGEPADSRYDAAAASCLCPSLDARRAWEKSMRTFGGN